MRVLYVDYSVGFGGAIKSLSLTLRELSGIEKLVLTAQDPLMIRTWLADYEVGPLRTRLNYKNNLRLRQAALRYSRAGEWLMSKALAVADVTVTALSAPRLARFIKRRGVDLVHLNNGIVPLEVLRAARRAGVPAIVHLRDFQHDKERAASRDAAGIDRVIAISTAVAASLDGSAVTPDRIVIVHDPVDVAAMDRAAAARERVRAQWGIAEGELAVAIFGRVIPWKGQIEFVRAAAEAARANPAIRPLIVGDISDGDEGYMTQVRQLIADCGLEGRCAITGYQEHVEEYYAAADIVVHASITPEPFGMVVPEAMAAGKAVIATAAGGPLDVVESGVDGLLVPIGDVSAMAQAILSLAGDPELRAGMGRAGRAKVIRDLSLQANAQRVSQVYADVLHERAASARAR